MTTTSATREHAEARCLAFSEFINAENGQHWSVTLREGVTTAEMAALLDAIKEMTRLAAERGLYHRIMKAPAAAAGAGTAGAAPPEHKSEAESRPAGKGAEGAAPARVGRVQVTGTEEAPVVEMYATNPALKWPVLKAPAGLVVSLLAAELGADEEALRSRFVCGRTHQVDWQVDWQASPKNPRWKDITGIKVITTHAGHQ